MILSFIGCGVGAEEPKSPEPWPLMTDNIQFFMTYHFPSFMADNIQSRASSSIRSCVSSSIQYDLSVEFQSDMPVDNKHLVDEVRYFPAGPEFELPSIAIAQMHVRDDQMHARKEANGTEAGLSDSGAFTDDTGYDSFLKTHQVPKQTWGEPRIAREPDVTVFGRSSVTRSGRENLAVRRLRNRQVPHLRSMQWNERRSSRVQWGCRNS